MDEELFENLPEPNDQDVERINPWRRPIIFTAWGIFLTTVVFRFLWLDKLLPAVGLLLMYLGLRPLRGENGGFRAAYWCSVGRLALELVALPIGVTPFYSAEAGYWLTVPAVLLQSGQLVALRAGLAGVFDRAGTERRLGSVNWLLVSTLAMAAGAILQLGNLGVFGIVFIILYIINVVAVARLPRALGDAGCVMRNSPVRLSDGAMAAATLGTLAVVTMCAWLGGLALSVPEARTFEPRNVISAPEGLPAEIWAILSDEDAALLERAENIRYDRTADNENGGIEGMHLCTVSAQLPGAEILVLQYFSFDEGGPIFGDGFFLAEGNRLTHTGLIHGRVVYERGGESLYSPMTGLQSGYRTFNNFFWQSSDNVITGDLYVPLTAKQTRGYVLYTVRAGYETLLNYYCQINYYHRDLAHSLTNAGSPSESLLNGSFDHQKQVVFYTNFTAWESEKPSNEGDFRFTYR